MLSLDQCLYARSICDVTVSAVTMKPVMFFVTILQISCVLRLVSSDHWTPKTTTQIPDTTTIRTRLDSLVENGRLLSNWSSDLTQDTEDVDFSNLGIIDLGSGIFEKFLALNRLDLSSNQLTSTKTIVNNIQNVTPMILNLSRNNIGEFVIRSDEYRGGGNEYKYDSLFESKFFWSVDLSHNSLTELTIDFDLVHFNLSYNKIRCHDKIIALRYRERFVANLNLSHNLIDCQSNFFTSSLNTLDMSYNKLRGLGNGLFVGLSVLAELDLSHNNIRYIHPQAFNDNSMLQKLYLGFNKIKSIYKWVWYPTKSLEYIDLSANDLGYLEWNNEAYATGRTNIRVEVGNNSNVRCSTDTHYSFYYFGYYLPY